MFTQSSTEINYQEDQWVNVMLIAIVVPIAAAAVFVGEIQFTTQRLTTIAPIYHNIMLLGPPAIAAVLTTLVLIKILSLARMMITTTGFTYINSGVARHYPWGRLDDLIFVDCGRGSGYYRINVTGENRPIKVNLPPFGVSRSEFESVITAARHGKLIDVEQLRRQLKEDDQKNAMSKLSLTMVVACLSIGVYYITRR